MNHSIVVPAKVLMNSLHRVASEPPTSIICVWKVTRWASGSSIPVKVIMGPPSVAGITAFTISVENGVGNSLGAVADPWSAPSRSVVWVCRFLRSSLFMACDATKSAWMRSWFVLDAATSSWRARIISITYCRVRASPPFGAIGSCLVLLIFLGFSGSCW